MFLARLKKKIFVIDLLKSRSSDLKLVAFEPDKIVSIELRDIDNSLHLSLYDFYSFTCSSYESFNFLFDVVHVIPLFDGMYAEDNYEVV